MAKWDLFPARVSAAKYITSQLRALSRISYFIAVDLKWDQDPEEPTADQVRERTFDGDGEYRIFVHTYVCILHTLFVCWDTQTCSVCVLFLCNCNCVITNYPLWCGLVCQKLGFEFVHLSSFMHFLGREEINPRYECGERGWCDVHCAVHSTAGAWQALAVTMDCFKLLAADAAKSAQLGRQGEFLLDTIYQKY